MKITSGGYEVLDTGTVISFKDESVIFHLDPLFKVKFTFEEDSSSSQQRVDVNLADTYTAELKIINHIRDYDAISNEPLYLGVLDGKMLYLVFRARRPMHGYGRIINYTWYVKYGN